MKLSTATTWLSQSIITKAENNKNKPKSNTNLQSKVYRGGKEVALCCVDVFKSIPSQEARMTPACAGAGCANKGRR